MLMQISLKRCLRILDYDIRKSPRGVMNWFIDSKGFLTLLFHVQGVDYVYREKFATQEEIPIPIYMELSSTRRVVGVFDESAWREQVDFTEFIKKPDGGVQ